MEQDKEAQSANQKKWVRQGLSEEEEKVALNFWSCAKAACTGPAVIWLGLVFTTLLFNVHLGSRSTVEGWMLQMAP